MPSTRSAVYDSQSSGVRKMRATYPPHSAGGRREFGRRAAVSTCGHADVANQSLGAWRGLRYRGGVGQSLLRAPTLPMQMTLRRPCGRSGVRCFTINRTRVPLLYIVYFRRRWTVLDNKLSLPAKAVTQGLAPCRRGSGNPDSSSLMSASLHAGGDCCMIAWREPQPWRNDPAAWRFPRDIG